MLDNTEKKILDVFNDYEIKLSSEDILNKSVKKKNIFKKILTFTIPSCVAICTLLFVMLNIDTSKSIIDNEIKQKSFISEIVGATNYLDTYEKTSKTKKISIIDTDESVKTCFEKIQDIVFASYNIDELNCNYLEEENTLFNNSYNYKCEIESLNQNYTFLYNYDNECLEGIIYNNDFVLLVNPLFSINVCCNFNIKSNKVYKTFNFSPNLVSMKSNTSFEIEEKEDKSIYYRYKIEGREIFTYSLFKENDITKINYEDLLLSCSFEIEKKDNKYKVNYEIGEIKGNFSIEI